MNLFDFSFEDEVPPEPITRRGHKTITGPRLNRRQKREGVRADVGPDWARTHETMSRTEIEAVAARYGLVVPGNFGGAR